MRRWRLTPDGAAFATPFGSRLAPVRLDGTPAMLKVAAHAEERDGAAVMAWWDGDGAAAVLAREGDAVLLARALGPGDLTTMVRDGRDDEASAILCGVAGRLHTPRARPAPSTLKPLEGWFRALGPAGRRHGGLIGQAAETARRLLAEPRDVTVLHGDLHHANVLDFGDRGWLAIDPKGLIGERGYDFANLFCNPWPEADAPDRFAHRIDVVARASGLEPRRLRQWVLAYGGLSAAWTLESDMPPDGPWRALRIAEIAAAGQ